MAHVAVAEPLHLDQYRVLVAVHEKLGDLEAVAGRFTLHPQRIARAAEERRKACGPRPLERLFMLLTLISR